MKSTEVPGLFLIPSGPIPPNPAELFHTQAFRDFVAAVSSRFERVIFDSPPVNAVADSTVLATHVDGTLLVVRTDATHKALARRAVRVLTDVKGKVLGAILTDVELRNPKYGALYAAYASEYHESREEPERRMRVLQLGKYYEPYVGGIETHLGLLARGLVARGVEVEVLVHGEGTRTVHESVRGIPVTRVGAVGRLMSTELSPRMVSELGRSYDVLHLHTPHPMAMLAYVAARKAPHSSSSPTTATSSARPG